MFQPLAETGGEPLKPQGVNEYDLLTKPEKLCQQVVLVFGRVSFNDSTTPVFTS